MELGQGSLSQYVSNTERAVQMNDTFYEQITSSAVSTLQYIEYLPIYPSKKNQHSGIQLKLCNSWDAWTYTEKKSYIKMDEVYEIPAERLTAAGANGRPRRLGRRLGHMVKSMGGLGGLSNSTDVEGCKAP